MCDIEQIIKSSESQFLLPRLGRISIWKVVGKINLTCLLVVGSTSGRKSDCHWRSHKEMRVRSLGWEDPLGEGMATHSSILAWKIPWTEELGRPGSIGSQRIIHVWSDLARMQYIETAFNGFSHVWLFATPWAQPHAPPPMGFSRQEYWSGLPFPSPDFND